jgi:hypothetical protein
VNAPLFFFEKKNQKTFALFRNLVPGSGEIPQTDKSLFASFSSEKEESSFYRSSLCAQMIPSERMMI